MARLLTIFVLLLLLGCDSPEPGLVRVIIAVDTETDGFRYGQEHPRLNLDAFRVGNIVDQTFDSTWRASIPDSYGNAVRYSWFLMTCECYGDRPGAVVSAFCDQYTGKAKKAGDAIGWHHHHAEWLDSRGWVQSFRFDSRDFTEHYHHFFEAAGFRPSTFRAGWLWRDSALSKWLDSMQIVDYSENSMSVLDSSVVDSLFRLAARGDTVVLQFYTHNYGSSRYLHNNAMKALAVRVHEFVSDYSKSYGVPWQYSVAH